MWEWGSWTEVSSRRLSLRVISFWGLLLPLHSASCHYEVSRLLVYMLSINRQEDLEFSL